MKINLRKLLTTRPDTEYIHKYKGFGNCPSECQVNIWEIKGIHFVLVINGIGTSVTNAAEQLATEIASFHFSGVAKGKVVFAETYNNSFEIDIDMWDIVWNDNKAVHVEWKHLGKLKGFNNPYPDNCVFTPDGRRHAIDAND